MGSFLANSPAVLDSMVVLTNNLRLCRLSAQDIVQRLYHGYKQYLRMFLLKHKRWADFQGRVALSGGSNKNAVLAHMIHDVISHFRVKSATGLYDIYALEQSRTV